MASTYNLLSLVEQEEGKGGKSSLELQKNGSSPNGKQQASTWEAFMSCGAYTVCSVGMVIANKAIST